jgi:hypothetical protein
MSVEGAISEGDQEEKSRGEGNEERIAKRNDCRASLERGEEGRGER